MSILNILALFNVGTAIIVFTLGIIYKIYTDISNKDISILDVICVIIMILTVVACVLIAMHLIKHPINLSNHSCTRCSCNYDSGDLTLTNLYLLKTLNII